MSTTPTETTSHVMTTEAVASNALSIAVRGLDPNAAQSLRVAFEAMFTQADEWIKRASAIRVTSEDQKHEMKFARDSRLALRQIRINAEKTRKQLKDESLRTGKAIDGLYNVIAALIEPVEAHLLEQENFAERQAEKRRNELREARKATLAAFGANPATYADLGLMTDEAWSQVVDAARSARDGRVAREREAREAAEAAAAKARVEAEERRAAEADRERVAAEDRARLERETAEARRVAAEERAAREKVEAAARAEREQQEAARREQSEALARAQRETAEANVRAESERRAREETERTVAARWAKPTPTEPAPATQPSTPSEMWAFAEADDDETWAGPFPTRDDAIHAAFAAHPHWSSCAVARAEWNDPTDGLSAEDVIEGLLSYVADNHYESAPDYVNVRITDEATAELDAALRAWAEKYLTHAYWMADSDRETVQRPGTAAAE